MVRVNTDQTTRASLARLQPRSSAYMSSQNDRNQMDTPKRLRSSCNACGAAKTKCDRNQPRCGRCRSSNLTCVYGPSKQLGKRPRRRLDIGPRFSDRTEASVNPQGTYQSPVIEGLATPTSTQRNAFDPMLDIGITPPGDIQLQLSEEPSIVWPHLEVGMLGERHRCYHESNEVIQLLSIPERLFPDDVPIVLDVSQILQANRRAVESLGRLVACKCAKTRGHQALLYASLISRVLWWYREAAGDEVHCAADSIGMPSPESSSGIRTPPPGIFPGTISDRCVTIKSSAVTVGGFSIDDPRMQEVFRNQLIRHEVQNVGTIIENFMALASDPIVPDSDRILFSTLGPWLRADLAKALAAIADATTRFDNDTSCTLH